MAAPHVHTVLVVDDDDDNLTALLFYLEALGHAVHGAGSGDDALRVLHTGVQPCVVVVDLIMPDMSGWELVARLRADAAFATVPVVLHTGAAEDPMRMLELGVRAALVKPCEPHTIADAIAAHCPRRDG